jgi:Protein of unknown function (DUF4038)/Domain of unknown function (DUF5060)
LPLWFGLNRRPARLAALALLFSSVAAMAEMPSTITGEQSELVELTFTSSKGYQDPFNEVDLDVIFVNERKQEWRVPAYWAGGDIWKVRFCAPQPGEYAFHSESSDKTNADLNGKQGSLRISPYRGSNSLLLHGGLQVGANKRYFQHQDGTPFFWLADTWWEGLCRRISNADFDTLADNRQAKGFSVVQIVAGLYSDQPPFDERAKNQGGWVWEPGYTHINPAYFDAADPRIQSLVQHQLTPAIVGSWGYYLPLMGMDNMKKHWRYLVARYGAYPVVWILAGEASMPFYLSSHPKEDSELQVKGFTELSAYVRSIDPYHHLITIHPQHSGRQELLNEGAVDFDMLQTGHESWSKAANTVAWMSAHYSKTPVMPTLVGESFYEGTQQTNWQDMERFAFWACMINGAAGHTYGAGGIWQMNTRAIPHGPSPFGVTYENTPWDEAMNLPGSQQMGVGKSILMKYPWWRFAPHPEWVDPRGTAFQQPHSEWFDVNARWDKEKGDYLQPYASGIPNEIRFIYIPPRTYDAWGPLVTHLEENETYQASYYDPMNGQRYKLGKVIRPQLPLLFQDSFQSGKQASWSDKANPTAIDRSRLTGHGSTWTILKDVNESDLLVSVEAKSDAEIGVALRFHDKGNSLVAVYSPALKGIWIHERQNGEYGARLGFMEVPEIGAGYRLVAEAHGNAASLTIADGKHIYRTTPVVVADTRPGPVGLWSERLACEDFNGRGGCRTAPPSAQGQNGSSFANFQVSELQGVGPDANVNLVILNSWRAPDVPITHDWVLVLER